MIIRHTKEITCMGLLPRLSDWKWFKYYFIWCTYLLFVADAFSQSDVQAESGKRGEAASLEQLWSRLSLLVPLGCRPRPLSPAQGHQRPNDITLPAMTWAESPTPQGHTLSTQMFNFLYKANKLVTISCKTLGDNTVFWSHAKQCFPVQSSGTHRQTTCLLPPSSWEKKCRLPDRELGGSKQVDGLWLPKDRMGELVLSNMPQGGCEEILDLALGRRATRTLLNGGGRKDWGLFWCIKQKRQRRCRKVGASCVTKGYNGCEIGHQGLDAYIGRRPALR